MNSLRIVESYLRAIIDSSRKILNKRYKINISVFIFFTLISILMTYPLILKLNSTLPDLGDPALNTYLLGWHAENFRNFYSHDLFSPNIFFPYKNTLFFTDSFIFLGFISGILSFFTNDPIVMYNLLTIGSFIFCGFFGYLLAHYYTKKTLPSILAGFIFAFAANHFGNLPHLQIISCFFIPLVFLYFEKFLKSYSKKDSFLFGLFLTLAGLVSLYQFVYTILGLIIVFGLRILISKYKFDWKKLIVHGLFSLISVVIVLVPLYFQYYNFSKEYNISRSVGENVYYSSDLTSIFISSGSNVLYGDSCKFISELGNTVIPCYEASFFPGIAVLILFLSLIFVFIKEKEGFKILITKNREYAFFILTTIIIYIFSLGPALKFLGHISGIKLPYYIFYEIFLPAQGTRVPGRLSMIFSLFIGVIAAIAIYKLIKDKKFLVKALIFILISGVIFIEFLNIPLNLVTIKNPNSKVFSIIKNESRINAVLELPIWGPTQTNISSGATLSMINSLKYNKGLVNGYSGFVPNGTEQFAQLFEKEINDTSLVILKKFNIDAILIDKNTSKVTLNSTWIEKIYEDENYILYINNANENSIQTCQDNIFVNFEIKNTESDKISLNQNYTSDKDCIWISKRIPSINYQIKFIADGKELKTHFSIKEPLFIPPNQVVVKSDDLRFDRQFWLFSNKLNSYNKIEVQKIS